MPGGFPLGLELSNWASSSAAASAGVALTPSATLAAKGSYVTMIASTPFDACWMEVFMTNDIGDDVDVDIAVGAVGSEVVIVNNLFNLFAGQHDPVSQYSFPISIPAGTRIAARCAANASSATSTLGCAINIYDGAFTQMEGCAGVDLLGAAPVSGTGLNTSTTLTSSASANTKGSYTQLVAATTRDYIGLLYIMFGSGFSGDITSLSDLAVGASGSEVVIQPNKMLTCINAGGLDVSWPNCANPIFTPVKAGSRIAARCQDDTGSEVIQVAAYGLYQ